MLIILLTSSPIFVGIRYAIASPGNIKKSLSSFLELNISQEIKVIRCKYKLEGSDNPILADTPSNPGRTLENKNRNEVQGKGTRCKIERTLSNVL